MAINVFQVVCLIYIIAVVRQSKTYPYRIISHLYELDKV